MKDDSGLTYSLEAMLGILLIAGVVVFVTGNPPPIAEPSGKYSKVQLVNLGEDILSLIASTPYGDTDVNKTALYINVSRDYTLVSNKTYAAKGEAVGFKIYYLGKETLTKELLTYSSYPNYSGGSGNTNNGTFNLSFPEDKEYQVQVKNAGTNLSNNVTIYVGDYLLLLNAYGIGSNDTIRGIVTKEGKGVENLSINIYNASNLILLNNTNKSQEGGRFLLKWAWGNGIFYINASDGTDSNAQKLLVADSPIILSVNKNNVFETRNVTLNLSSGPGQNSSVFYANNNPLSNSDILFADIGNGQYNLTFNRSGSYIIQYKNVNESNPVLITVHSMESYLASPLSYFLGTEYLRLRDFEKLVGPYIPENIDYNLYLYRVSGDSLVEEEKVFDGKIPSHDAVVVSRLVRSEAIDGTGVLRELRIVLWYR